MAPNADTVTLRSRKAASKRQESATVGVSSSAKVMTLSELGDTEIAIDSIVYDIKGELIRAVNSEGGR